MTFQTADLYDRYEDRVWVCEPLFRDFGRRRAFFGQIATVKCFEDNTQVKSMLAEPGRGRVLVVDAGGSLRCAMLGDLIAKSAVTNGWAGIVLYGCVRDSERLGRMDLGIKALRAIPRKSVRRDEGQRNLPVSFAAVTFFPGHWAYADADGILICASALNIEP